MSKESDSKPSALLMNLIIGMVGLGALFMLVMSVRYLVKRKTMTAEQQIAPHLSRAEEALARNDYKGAVTHYKYASSLIDEKVNPLLYADTQEKLVDLFFTKGDLHAASLELYELISIREQQQGMNHPLLPKLLRQFALTLEANGYFELAEERILRALQIDELHHTPDHLDLCADLTQLGRLRYEYEAYPEAEQLFLRSFGMLFRLHAKERLADEVIQAKVQEYLALDPFMRLTEERMHTQLEDLWVKAGLDIKDFWVFWKKSLDNH